MHDQLPSCFRGSPAGMPPATAAGPTLSTSVYETHVGLAALTWSRAVLGLSLRLDLRLGAGADHHLHLDHFRVRPWLLWCRRGSRRFSLSGHRRSLVIAWDLSRARFPASGAPDPCSSFFVAVVLDGELLLVSGDLVDEARRKTRIDNRGKGSLLPPLVSRMEHVGVGDAGGGARVFTTAAVVGSREHEVSVELAGKDRDPSLWFSIDGERVLHVRRVRWKFRGSERVDLAGRHVQISWDLYSWLFPAAKDLPPPPDGTAGEPGRAVFVVRFDDDSAGGDLYHASLGKRSPTTSDGIGRLEKGKAKSLVKTPSSSSAASTSTASSSASGSSVMDWASSEEDQLRHVRGFSLLVYAWKL